MTQVTTAPRTTPTFANTPADLLRDAAFVLRLTARVKSAILADRPDRAPTTYPPAKPAVEKAATGTAC